MNSSIVRSCAGPWFIVLGLLAGGNAAAEIELNETGNNMSEQANLDAVRSIYAGFAAGDMQAALGSMSDTIIWEHPGTTADIPFAGRFKGKDGVLRFFEIAGQVIDVLDQQIREMIPNESKVAVLGYEHMRVKATGREYKSNWVHLYTFRDGKIVYFEEFIDTAALRRAFATGQ